MTNYRITIALVAIAGVGAAAVAMATVAGGGKAKSDCYSEFGGITATKGATTVECTDGDACDQDGANNCSCDFGAFQLCLNQTDVAGCTPPAGGLASLAGTTKVGKIKTPFSVTGPSLTSSACGAFPGATVVALAKNKAGKAHTTKENISLKATAQAGVKPGADPDKLILVCKPAATPCAAGTSTTSTTSSTTSTTIILNVPDCPGANPGGGPDQLVLTVTPGSDLDNGWTGISHDFPVPVGTTFTFCLSPDPVNGYLCDATTDPRCKGTGATDVGGAGSLNGPAFGAPLPLVAGGIPVCVVNKYKDATITAAVANVQTGELTGAIHLNSEVWLTPAATVCPKCSGGGLGVAGTCSGGPNKNQPCHTEGIVVVNSDNPPIHGDLYTLSHECPPGGSGNTKAATLPINLDPLTTGQSTKTGPKPCPGAAGAQVADDGCKGGAACTPCPGNLPPPDKGGIDQFCCADSNHTPCFPTKANSVTGGMIIRDGKLEAPAPAWPDTTYPKTGVGGTTGENLANVFCIDRTNSNIDGVTGLPGPGALILPVKQCYKKLGQDCVFP